MFHVHIVISFLLKPGSAKSTSLSSYIGSSHSDIMQNTTFYCGILLAVFFGFGVIYEIARLIRGTVLFILSLLLCYFFISIINVLPYTIPR